MVRNEEVRPLDGMHTPLHVRRGLRQMFERWLSRSPQQRFIVGPDERVNELCLLELCKHYRLEYPGGAVDIAKGWNESEQRIADGGPTFDALVRSGWIFFDGGRWNMLTAPLGTFSGITYPSPSTKIFLTGLGKARLVARTDKPSSDAQALAGRFSAEDGLDWQIPTRDPDWLAGRLWEQLCPKPQLSAADRDVSITLATASIENGASDTPEALAAEIEAVDKAFLEWSAWCRILGYSCSWDMGWGVAEMRYCREAAHRVLNKQAIWGGWDNDAERYADVLENTFLLTQDQLRFRWTSKMVPPRTLVSRVDWLNRPDVEPLMMNRLGTSTVSFAFGLLCSELEKTDIGPGILTAAATVLTFAVNHPMALQGLLFRVKATSALLVDMLMHPLCVCLAAKLAIEWPPESGRDSDRNVIREAQVKAFAVQDALSLLAYHLGEGTLNLEEYASLVTWCYDDGRGRSVADSRRPVGRQLFRMIAKEKDELQSEVLRHLVALSAYEDNIPRARFAGVLDGLNLLPNVPIADAFPIIALYSKFARDLHLDWTDASTLSAELAVRLIAIALAQATSDQDALLVPFDSAKLLRETPDDEKFSVGYFIAKTLRAHVRLLARAVAGWSDCAVPRQLFDPFQALVARSVIEHAEKGRFGALTDSCSPNRFFAREEGSPAQDLTAAWRRLDKSQQEALLQALAQSDDPVLLAELCQHLPAAAKPLIQTRLRQLKPGEASTLWTWPELQHRIESLLVAGEHGLAREHLDEAEHDLPNAPSQFQVGLFGLRLRLLLKEKNWTVLDSTVIPSELDVPSTRQAQDLLDFYKATSQLLRPNGNLANARFMLQSLAARPGAASAYKENVFAVAIQQLLGPNLHPLTGDDKSTGEDLLAEINAAVTADTKLAHSTLFANRALLLMALQRPEEALESVAVHRQETRSLEIEIVAVLAKTEMGLQGEAMAMLDAAITEFGTDDRLIALKSDLQTGVATPSVASASVAVNLTSSIRAALQQLTELQVSQVGDVLGPPGRGVRGYLVREVSRAVAALQHMAAMLRDRKNPENEAKLENDLNTSVRELLGARLAVAKWDVADQSLGGATSSGNPGERDAVIRVSGQEISIYEALVCSGLDRSYTKKHFDKLLSYGVCDIYFHVTYSYAKDLKPLLDYVRQMLEHEVPPGLAYISCEVLGPPDYETSGYIATYRADDHRDVAVVFFIADLSV